MSIFDTSDFIYQQPNSNHCFVCGRHNPRGLYMTFFDNGKDEVISHYTVDPVYQGYPGVVHGGVVASMLDEVVGRVAMATDPHRFMFSVTLQVKYRHNVPTDTPLLVRGSIVRLRKRLGKARGEILLPDGKVAAEAEMTLANVPAEILVHLNLPALGWYIDTKTKGDDHE